MTYNQEMFIEYILQGYKHREAYVKAFPQYADMKPSQLDNRAHKIMIKPEAKAYFDRRESELKEQMRDNAKWTRERAVNELLSILDTNKREMLRYDESYLAELEMIDRNLGLLKKKIQNTRLTKKERAGIQSQIDAWTERKIRCNRRQQSNKSVNDAILQSITQLNALTDVSLPAEQNEPTKIEISFATDRVRTDNSAGDAKTSADRQSADASPTDVVKGSDGGGAEAHEEKAEASVGN